MTYLLLLVPRVHGAFYIGVDGSIGVACRHADILPCPARLSQVTSYLSLFTTLFTSCVVFSCKPHRRFAIPLLLLLLLRLLLTSFRLGFVSYAAPYAATSSWNCDERKSFPLLADYLNSNQLSGAIPTEIGSIQTLQQLWLSDNNLSGPIPEYL